MPMAWISRGRIYMQGEIWIAYVTFITPLKSPSHCDCPLIFTNPQQPFLPAGVQDSRADHWAAEYGEDGIIPVENRIQYEQKKSELISKTACTDTYQTGNNPLVTEETEKIADFWLRITRENKQWENTRCWKFDGILFYKESFESALISIHCS